MSTKKIVYVVVVSDTDYHYDLEQNSYLPELHPVLGVYKDYYAAHGKVYRTFDGANSDKYEELKVDGETYQYKYEDKEYGGYVIYTIRICKQRVGEED